MTHPHTQNEVPALKSQLVKLRENSGSLAQKTPRSVSERHADANSAASDEYVRAMEVCSQFIEGKLDLTFRLDSLRATRSQPKSGSHEVQSLQVDGSMCLHLHHIYVCICTYVRCS